MNSTTPITKWLTENTALPPKTIQMAFDKASETGDSPAKILLSRGLLSQEQYLQLTEISAAKSTQPSSGSLPKFLGYEGIDRYEILEEIGQGGMGKVYLAKVKETGTTVVIKTLIKVKKSAKEVERFHREGMALARLSHPHIARVYDFRLSNAGASEQCHPYLVMEYVSGQTLGQYFEARHRAGLAFDAGLLKSIFAPLAKALIHCHESGIIHRDIKPENILIEEAEDTKVPPRPVLIDFGLAKVDKETTRRSLELSQQLTKSGQLLGSPAFAAPEQLHGEIEKFGPAMDVWGWAASLYWAASGQLPYQVSGLYQLFAISDSEDPEPLRKHNPEIPLWLEQICSQCLQRNPHRRPSLTEALTVFKNESAVSPTSSKRGPMLGLAAICLLILSALLFFNRDQELPQLELSLSRTITQAKTIQLKGRVLDEAPARLWLRGQAPKTKKRSYPVNEDGSFKVVVDLKDGQNTFSIWAEDQSGNLTQPERITLVKDDNPPNLTALVYPKLTYDSEVTVIGEFNEPSSIQMNGSAPSLFQPSFRQSIALSIGRNSVMIMAKDEAGNVRKKTITITRHPVYHLVPASQPIGRPNEFHSLAKALAKAAPLSRILIHPGTYESGYEIEKSLELQGVGERSKVVLRSSGEPLAIRAPKVYIRNLTIENTGSNNQCDALQIFANDCHLENCTVTSKFRRGLNIGYNSQLIGKRAPTGIRLEKCVFIESGQTGVVANLNSSASISGCKFIGNKLHGLLVKQKAKIQFKNCRFEKNLMGLKLDLGGVANGKDSVFILNKEEGITVEIRSQASISRCQLIENGGIDRKSKFSQARATFSSRLKLTDCVLKDGARDGVFSYELSQIELNNCEIRNNGGFGVKAQVKSTIDLRGCILKNNGRGPKNEILGGKIKIQKAVSPDQR